MCDMALKLPPGFLPADRKAYCLVLPFLVSLLSGGTAQPENTNPCILKVTGHV